MIKVKPIMKKNMLGIHPRILINLNKHFINIKMNNIIINMKINLFLKNRNI
ncbi:hypothetical protein [Blattabacterium cuenoti]|uniref:hypothetical protein n=1 Tax=Blattabacterium cuenoti TaxID=1653831 RepID=UPI00163CE38D|nr:hypothetical protein [Blattabacterium cuenoti]